MTIHRFDKSTGRRLRSLSRAFVVAGLVTAAGSLPLPPVRLHAQATALPPADFTAFLARVDAAQLELQNGRVGAFKALWSRADDVTLSGGFGGAIEKGWEAVGRRLDWVGTQFSNGTNRIERVVSHAGADLGYVIQAEHLRFRVPGQANDSTKDYRVTMIFRREAGEWRLVHRQADSQTVKRQ